MHGNVVTGVVSGVLNYRGRFCVDYHAVYAGTCYQWVCEVLQFVVAAHLRSISPAKRRLHTSHHLKLPCDVR